MIEEINKIIDNLEGCIGMFDYLLTPIESNLLVSYIRELQQENEKLHHYKALYQSLKRQKEELRSWLKEDKDKIKVFDTKNDKAVEVGIMLGMRMCVEKMEELEQPKKELLKPTHYDEDIDVEYELEKARKFIQEES